MSKLSAEDRAQLLNNVAKTTRLLKRGASIPAYRMRARALSTLGRHKEALADFTKIIELAPSADAYKDRADLYAALKRDRQAVADYTRAIELKPDVYWYNVRGNFYLERGRYAKALADYVKAVEISPSHIIARCPKSFEATLDEHRLRSYTRQIEREPSAWNFEQRGNFYLERGQYVKALADFQRSVELDPNYNFDELPEDLEEPVNAHRIIGYTKRIEDAQPDVNYRRRGDVYFAMGNYAQAIADYSVVIERYPYDYESLEKRAKTYLKLKRYDAAIRDFKRLIERSGDTDCYFDLGGAYLETQRYKEAAQCFGEVIKREPQFATAYYNRGSAYFYSGQYAAARADFDEYLRLEPDDCDGYDMRGKCYRALGDTSRAQTDFARSGISGRRLF